MKSPVHTIASNAGVEGAVVVGKLLGQDNTDLGYDAAKGLIFFSSRYMTCKRNDPRMKMLILMFIEYRVLC